MGIQTDLFNASNSIEETLEKFENLRQAFEDKKSYGEKLEFWSDSNFTSLTVYVSYLDKQIKFWKGSIVNLLEISTRHKSIVSRDRVSVFIEFISIIPSNPEEFETFVYWGEEALLATNRDEYRIEYYLSEYNRIINESPLYKEYLFSEIEKVENAVERYETSYDYESNDRYKSPIRFLFDFGYNTVLKATKLNYKELYDKTYSTKVITSDESLYAKPEAVVKHILKGILMAEYLGFLLNEKARIDKGENIRRNSDNSRVEELKKITTKLIWNGEKEVLYDLLVQLMTRPANDKSKMLIGNNIASLAQFISEHVEGAGKADTIASRLSKIKNDEGERPKRYRIDIQIDRTN